MSEGKETRASINYVYFRDVPENYKILLMQGGGTGAFASVALNLMHRGEKADYILTGTTG